MSATEITADILRQIVEYDPETGVFTWCARPVNMFTSGKQTAIHNKNAWCARNVGKTAGWLAANGYIYISVGKRALLAHRVAWLFITGEWPKEQIDHVNMNRSDNRFANLREASHSDNLCNRRVRSDSLTGIKGVSVHSSGLFQARIKRQGVTQRIGYFKTADEASAAYSAAAEKFHGEFARTA